MRKRHILWIFVIVMLGVLYLFAACGGSSGDGQLVATWVSGAAVIGQKGVYGTQGIADLSNMPGGRQLAVSWTDSQNHLWLFGGTGYDSTGRVDFLNDLWKFDENNWTWISGANVCCQKGIYGPQGTAGPSNVPGARSDSLSWMDSQDHLWLFGGYGYDSAGNTGLLNDLWEFDGSNWTWVSGANAIVIGGQGGVYGTQGTADPSNVPGARSDSISWMDSQDHLWLFGGAGYDSRGQGGVLNDLWRFDGSNWTWVSGAKVGAQKGVYGTQGTPDSSNMPGARWSSVSWMDSQDYLWLFGGSGFDSTGLGEYNLNDLWKFDGTSWTWISGADVCCQKGIYITQGKATKFPGARNYSVSWMDSQDHLWLFGGLGIDYAAHGGLLNDLWKITP